MSAVPWIIAALAVLAVPGVWRLIRAERAARAAEAFDRQLLLPPSPGEVAGLVGVLTAASKPGASMADIALAVLSANYRQRRGASR